MNVFRSLGLATVFMGLAAVGLGQQGATQTEVDARTIAKIPGVKVDQQPGATLPMLATFKDEKGHTVQFGSYFKGHPVLLLPIFYRCVGVCNQEMQGVVNDLLKSPKMVPGQNVEVVALGINPSEVPELAADKKQVIMEEYGKPKTANGWHFLTGDLTNIRSVTDAMGFRFTYDPAQKVVNHPSGMMMLTADGKVSSYMLAGTYDISRFQDDFALATKGGIAPKTEDEFLGCVCFDPVTGKRSLIIQGVVRLFGIFTVLALVLGIFFLSRRPRTYGNATR